MLQHFVVIHSFRISKLALHIVHNETDRLGPSYWLRYGFFSLFVELLFEACFLPGFATCRKSFLAPSQVVLGHRAPFVEWPWLWCLGANCGALHMKQISRRARRMDMILFLMFTQNEHAYIEYMLANWRYANLKQLLCTRRSKTLIIFKSFELKKWNFLVKLFKTIGGKAGQRVCSYSFKSINDRWLYHGKPFGFIVS